MYLKNLFKALKQPLGKIFFSTLLSFGIIALTLSGDSSIVYATGGLTLSTSYSGITVKPGETVEFPLLIDNNGLPSQSFELAVQSAPEGWEGSFQGLGKSVHKVFVRSGSTQSIDFKVTIPAETEEGTYQVVLRAKGAGVTDSLILDLKVSKDSQEESKLVSQYPELQGPGSAIFKFRMDLTNNMSKEQSYSLGVKVPAGWGAAIKPSYDDKQIASISLQPKKSQGLDIEITPPRNPEAGEYRIPVSAVSADETIVSELKIIITGTYDIDLSTPTGKLNFESYAGKESAVTLKVTNTASADLKDVSFSSWEPSNWTVTFKPEKIDLLKPGESQEIKAYVKPDSRAIAGDYAVRMTARTKETSSNAEFRVMVKTPTAWGIVGIAVIALLAGGLYRTFKVYGRR